MNTSARLTRRRFLVSTSCLGSAAALAKYFTLPALADSLARDARVEEKPLLDRGFASARRIGDGVYATVSDVSKGFQTLSNGGFLIGRDAAFLIEGHGSTTGAAFELEALRMVSQLPIRAALDTHYHFDHSFGNAFYGGMGIPIWAHSRTAPMMVDQYARLQGQDEAAALAPWQKRVQQAASDAARERAEGDLHAFQTIFQSARATAISLPNHPLDPSALPMKIDLGGLTAVIETYPGHSPTDVIVRVPEQNIVFTGDLLFNRWYPVTFDGDMAGWHRTLEKFAGFGKDTIFVPGHGQVCGQEGIALLREVLEDLAEQAKKLYAAGVPVEEAEQRYVVPDRFKDLRIFAWGLTVGSAIRKLYAEYAAAKS